MPATVRRPYGELGRGLFPWSLLFGMGLAPCRTTGQTRTGFSSAAVVRNEVYRTRRRLEEDNLADRRRGHWAEPRGGSLFQTAAGG
jgi:hypothetical protein